MTIILYFDSFSDNNFYLSDVSNNKYKIPQDKISTIKSQILLIKKLVDIKFNDVIIAKGKWGRVYRSSDGKYIKKVIEKHLSFDMMDEIINSIKIKNLGRNKNIIYFVDYLIEKNRNILIFEYGGINMYDFRKTYPHQRIPEKEALIYIKQMCQAINFLHIHGIAHRDLKLENFLILDNIIKLADFDVATTDLTSNKIVGTAVYISPELDKGLQYDTKKNDIWAMGVIAFELVYGIEPFEDSYTTRNIIYKFPLNPNVSEYFKDCIKKIFVLEDKRSSNIMTLFPEGDLKILFSEIMPKYSVKKEMTSKILYFYLSQSFRHGYTIHIEKDNFNPEYDDHIDPEDYIKIEFLTENTVNTEWKYKIFVICYFPTEEIIYEKTLKNIENVENVKNIKDILDKNEIKKIEDIIDDIDDDDEEYFYIIMDNNYEVINKNMIEF
jgi:serine/threonine protein kinase